MKIVQFCYSMREKYFPKLPHSPHMDLESITYFANQLGKSDIYVEFGSGGSTILAATLNVPFIVSVDSDDLWMRRVRRRLLRIQTGSQISLVHAEVGKVGSWGTPTEKVDGELRYANTPWKAISNISSEMLVLIDGRFRVTCFLVSLLNCPEGAEILFDDYYDRDSYQIVEEILKPQIRVGRSAVFIIPKDLNEFSIRTMISSFKFDSD